MVRVQTEKTAVARAKLTEAQKTSRRARNELLTEDLTATQKGWVESVRTLAKKHGR